MQMLNSDLDWTLRHAAQVFSMPVSMHRALSFLNLDLTFLKRSAIITFGVQAVGLNREG